MARATGSTIVSRSGYEDRLAIHSMLGLREEIGGDKIGIRRLVRDHLYLGWSGGHINGDLFQAY